MPGKKILIVGPAWIGDMVMAQSLFKVIKERDAQAILHILAPAWTFSLLKNMPEVTQAIALPFGHGELKLFARYQFAKRLQAERYDQAIVLPNSFKAALIPWFAKIPQRTGWLGEYRYGVLTDIRKLDKKRYQRMVEQFIALGLPAKASFPASYTYPAFTLDSLATAVTLTKFNLRSQDRPILAIGPGAAYGEAKRWPPAYFAEVANHKLKQGWQVWLFGSKNDNDLVSSIMTLTDNRCENLAGYLELNETIDLLSFASGVLTNDSGLMHMAAALSKPIIALYGSTSPDFTPPLAKEVQILKLNLDCQPCFKRICPLGHFRCMRDLSPLQVLKAMEGWQV